MSKRTTGKFKRRRQDAYDTPPEALAPLLPYLPDDAIYAEPCAGGGMLLDALEAAGRRTPWATDIKPRRDDIGQDDAMSLTVLDVLSVDFIVTNPPWTRQILHPMIDHFRELRPTWLLFDADWMHTLQAIPFLPYCHKIVSVGRVSWMQNGTSSLDNAAWYFFDRELAQTDFVGRVA